LNELPDVNRQLVELIAKATEPAPEARFATAADLEDALSSNLARHFPTFKASTLARIVNSLVAETPTPSEPDREGLSLMSLTGTATFLARPSTLSSMGTGRAEGAEAPAAGTREVARGAPSPRRKWVAAAALAVVAAGIGVGLTLRARVTEKMAAAPAPVAVAPAIPPVPAVATPGSAPPTPIPTPAPSPPSRPKHPRPAPRSDLPVETGFLTVYSESWGRVIVDGKKFADTTPLYRRPLAVGSHRVTVFHPETNAHAPVQTVSIKAGEARSLVFR
jgi:hypothetical protein